MIQGLDIWYQRTRDGRRLTGDGLITLPKILPSEYFHSQIWLSFVDDPLGVKMVGSVLDVDKVMFGSDYPHPRKHLATLTAGHPRTVATHIFRRAAKNHPRQMPERCLE